MKEIKLLNLKLHNFKGLKKFELKADGNNINVYGENGTGKTTIFDAFTWLLFGKDSHFRTAFGIKTFDDAGQVISGLEHSVEAELMVNDKVVTLKKTYKEKWTKKRNEPERTLTGHETKYWMNEVPSKQAEYINFIKAIMDEDVFKLITNTLYFNDHLPWRKRRELLLSITGDILDVDVLDSNEELHPLISILNKRTLEEHKKIITGKKKKYNEEIKAIPIRIDEINLNLPELPEKQDLEKLEQDKVLYLNKIDEIDERINSQDQISEQYRVKSKERNEKNNQLFELKMNIERDRMKHLNEINKELSENGYKKDGLEQKIKNTDEKIEELTGSIKKLDEEIIDLRNDWDLEFKKEFDEPDRENFICPTCKQKLPEEDIDSQITSMKANFKHNKKAELDKIQRNGKFKSKKKSELEDQLQIANKNLNEYDEQLTDIRQKISDLESEKAAEEQFISDFSPETDDTYMKLKKELVGLENELQDLNNGSTVSKSIEEKGHYRQKLDEINKTLNIKSVVSNAKTRIEDLKAQEKRYSDEILKLEKEEYLIDQFIITKVNMLEAKINDKFKFVKFKLFNRLVNGAIEECCETMVDGVPYMDLNTASCINAGLDIINVLTEHYGVRAPIFIDNRESINEIIDTGSQVISLVVSKDNILNTEVA